ncbi:SDR family NAD(P)-dependent oxidoreductase [Amycolatopsis sp.]|uniref:SDR family NAD(P)-dependent oxidoreductase n=1 Tax=Amycolatopsis sp. TaxID=37632 RepID=UPI002B9174DD|nr:SDR family NAD(P)-dependent oxidoreductase [Amycolatopsis sp.]HVV11149.1 SDR family NAD(P)-dependent oxidoreductase [Amycolatopsis sp.]
MKVALITGASRGIGAAAARRLAADGLAVAINSYPDETLITAAKQLADDIQDAGGEAIVLPADITDSHAVDKMFTACEEQLGEVSALVLNAAATGRQPWDSITESAWDNVSAVNLRGAFLCSRRAFGDGQGPDSGTVVVISSVLAKLGAPQSLHYATTKAGLLGFTRSLAKELGPRGIRVNAVLPGAIQTEEELESFPDQEAVRQDALSRQFLQRRGLAVDVAGTISFLVGPDSGFMTGQTLSVDGGWVLL